MPSEKRQRLGYAGPFSWFDCAERKTCALIIRKQAPGTLDSIVLCLESQRVSWQVLNSANKESIYERQKASLREI
jgi:hypothetical protein